jgi:glutaredoxin
MVLIYTRSGCMPCKAAKRLLDQLQVPYSVFTLPDGPEAVEGLPEALRGYTQLPIIVFPTGSVETGFYPDRIRKACAQL